MDTKVVNNREEFEDFYFYDKKYMREEHYPTEYPCLVIKEDVDAGISGSQVVHQIIYCPDGYDTESFFCGVARGMHL